VKDWLWVRQLIVEIIDYTLILGGLLLFVALLLGILP